MKAPSSFETAPATNPGSAGASPYLGTCRRGAAGFTMIEIAIALAVIAFALVAIIGLLPLGMETQRDNRQETIINHDGAYLMEAIRGGAPYVDDLAQYVDSVNVNGIPVGISDSADLVKALSTVNSTNEAIMRALSGAAASRAPSAKDFAMRYRVVSQVLPAWALGSVDRGTIQAGHLSSNLFEIRLALYWPVTPQGKLADSARRQVFRTVVSGSVDTNGFLNTSVFEKK